MSEFGKKDLIIINSTEGDYKWNFLMGFLEENSGGKIRSISDAAPALIVVKKNIYLLQLVVRGEEDYHKSDQGIWKASAVDIHGNEIGVTVSSESKKDKLKLEVNDSLKLNRRNIKIKDFRNEGESGGHLFVLKDWVKKQQKKRYHIGDFS